MVAQLLSKSLQLNGDVPHLCVDTHKTVSTHKTVQILYTAY